MSSVNCLVPAGGSASSATDRLEQGLVAIHERFDPGRELTVSWQEVPEGYMFTEGRPSTTSVVAFTLEAPTTLDQREALLRQVCDLFVDVTGCRIAEVLGAITPNQEHH